MPRYRCKIGTTDGRVLVKQYQSLGHAQLKQALEDQGFHVFSIRRCFFSFSAIRSGEAGHLDSRRLLTFSQELLALLRSGVPVMQIFDTQLEQLESGRFRDILSGVREKVRGGSTLSDAFGSYPRHFPLLFIAALRAGERTGDLPDTLDRFITYRKRMEDIRTKVRNASFYPLLLVFAALAVVIFLLLYVVPRFTSIYADAQVELPLMTRLLVGVSAILVEHWYLLPFAVVAIVAAVRLIFYGSRGRLHRARFLLKLPFFGKLTADYAITAFTRTLSTILLSGVPIVEGLQMARGTLNNLSLEQLIVKATQRVEEGEALADALQKTGFFPPLAQRMIRVGESSGSLSQMLADVADYYEAEVERRLSRLTTLIEPVLMMTMGLLIAFIVVAMYVPIFQLAATVG